MSILGPMTPADFPLVANGQYVYGQRSSGAIIGPVDMHLAADLALRLNRDHAEQIGRPARWTSAEVFTDTVKVNLNNSADIGTAFAEAGSRDRLSEVKK